MSIVREITKPDQTKYRLGEPWKLPRAAGFIVPIHMNKPYAPRGYVMIQESDESVTFTDSGGISGVNARNKSGKHVYIRKGTLLKGAGTQSRAPVHGFVLEPMDIVVEVPVNCVHQTHGIRSGAKFHASGVAPMSVQAALGKQSKTWNSISSYSRKISRRTSGLGSLAEDNLVDYETALESDPVVDSLKNIPGDHVDQVGVAVFDMDGLVAVEIFDHPESWKAFSGSIVRSYREILTLEAGEFMEVRTEKAGEAFWRTMKQVESMDKVLINETSKSRVWKLENKDNQGELVELEGKEIHLQITRRSETPDEPVDDIQELLIEESIEPQRYVQKRGGYQILDQLKQTPQRFKELLESVDVSRGTLSRRVKEAESLGLIEKGIRKTNGHPAYILTEDGEKTKKKAEEKTK